MWSSVRVEVWEASVGDESPSDDRELERVRALQAALLQNHSKTFDLYRRLRLETETEIREVRERERGENE